MLFKKKRAVLLKQVESYFLDAEVAQIQLLLFVQGVSVKPRKGLWVWTGINNFKSWAGVCEKHSYVAGSVLISWHNRMAQLLLLA